MYQHEKQRVLEQLDELGITFGHAEVISSRLIDEMLSYCPDCGKTLDAFRMCPDVSQEDAARGIPFCGVGYISPFHPDSCSCETCCYRAKTINTAVAEFLHSMRLL